MRAWDEALSVIARLVPHANRQRDRLGAVPDRPGEHSIRVRRNHEVDRALPDVQRGVDAGKLQGLRGRRLDCFATEAVRCFDIDLGGDHAVRHGLAVGVQTVGNFQAHDESPAGADAKYAPSAAKERGDPDAVIFGDRLDGFAGTGLDSAEEAVEDRLDALAVREVAVEELVDDHSVFVEQEEPGKWHAVERHIVRLDQGVQHPIAVDDIRVDVGQHGEFDARRLNVSGKCLGVVVADGVQLDALSAKFRKTVVQLDQLRQTRRSPDGGAKEQNRSTRAVAIGMKRDVLAVVVW